VDSWRAIGDDKAVDGYEALTSEKPEEVIAASPFLQASSQSQKSGIGPLSGGYDSAHDLIQKLAKLGSAKERLKFLIELLKEEVPKAAGAIN